MENDRPLTTADLAGRNRTEERTDDTAPVRVQGETRQAAAVAEPEPHPFFATEEGDRFRSLWRDIQTAFVDDPRGSVHKADALVAQVMQSLAGVFADERAGLEGQWSRGDDVSTEDLRVALQRYRAFFDRLLSV